MIRRLQTIKDGYEIARADGIEHPTHEQMIWYIVQEAADTLERLPDREREQRLSGKKSHMPEMIGRASRRPLHKGAPTGDAIDRLDELFRWFSLISEDRIRKIKVLLALGGGASAGKVAGYIGVHRDTPLKLRDRALLEIAIALKERARAA